MEGVRAGLVPIHLCHQIHGLSHLAGALRRSLPPAAGAHGSKRGRFSIGPGCWLWGRAGLGRTAELIDAGEQALRFGVELSQLGVLLPWPPAGFVSSCLVSFLICLVLSSIRSLVIGGEESDQAESKAAHGFCEPQPVQAQRAGLEGGSDSGSGGTRGSSPPHPSVPPDSWVVPSGRSLQTLPSPGGKGSRIKARKVCSRTRLLSVGSSWNRAESTAA